MKKRAIIIFDVIMLVVVLMGLILNTKISTKTANLQKTANLAENAEYEFNLIPCPEKVIAKTGETITVDISIEDIKMGELGLNNVTGFLSYDEGLFDEVNFYGAGECWKVEMNKEKGHDLYGKFVIYTLSEGIKEDQDIAKLVLKLKDNIEEGTTEVKLTDLKSSDGEVSVNDEDRKIEIKIVRDEESKPAEEAKEPTQKEEKKQENINKDKTTIVKTGDNIYGIIIFLVISTVILNILVMIKQKNNESGKIVVKVGTLIVTSLILIGTAILCFITLAHNTETLEQINKLSIQESWLNSEKYLVTDETVSRIAPLTNYEEIEHKFNKELKVYKQTKENDTYKQEEITSGLLGTGMIVQDKNETYEVSVLGDLDGNGDSNHVELTTIIRSALDGQKWKLDGAYKISADMNVDGLQDEKDIITSIKYILYGDIRIPSFNQVKVPKIEVVEGTYNNYLSSYEDEIKIKITEQEKNALKTKYKVEGQITTEWQEIENGGRINLTENGVYKISAYTYGELGNRSQIVSKIIIKKNPNSTYKIIRHTEKVDGTYETEEESIEGRIGETVSVEDEIQKGFEINNEKSTVEGIIPEEGELTLEVYYDRSQYTLTLNAGDDIESVSIGEDENKETGKTLSKSIKYGKTVHISAKLDNKPESIITWRNWIVEDDATERAIPQEADILMPSRAVTLTATANKIVNQYDYKVEYYYEGERDDSKTEVYTVDYGTEITEYENKKPLGYEQEKTENLPLTVGTEEENNIIKIYYIKTTYNIEYDLKGGNLGLDEEQNEKTNPTTYTVTDESFTLNNPSKQGYHFIGWTGGVINEEGNLDENIETGLTPNIAENNPMQNVTIEKGSVGNRKYIANYAPNTDTMYTVEHYFENLDGSYEKDDTLTQTKYGTTGEKVQAIPLIINGFTEDPENENRISEGNIKADGTLVLKLYYTRNKYTLTLNAGENIEEVSLKENKEEAQKETGKDLQKTYKYGAQIDISAEPKTQEGHTITWKKWESSDENILEDIQDRETTIEIPASNIELTATATNTTNKYNYKIEYYYDGEKDETKTEIGNVEYRTEINDYTSKRWC